jgi:hypothetical protein
MKAQILAAFGSASMAMDRWSAAEGDSCSNLALDAAAALERAAADLRRAGSSADSEPSSAGLAFARAMRRVEAECYNTL